MQPHGILLTLVFVFLLLVCSTAPATTGEPEKDNFSGRLFRAIAGDTLENDYEIAVLGWAQATALYSGNETDDVSPQGFFNTEDSFNLNQIGLMFCRGDGCPPLQFGPKHNVINRIGPWPGPRHDEFDIGFNVTAIYGKDSRFFGTDGLDDFNFDDDSDEKLSIPQWYLDSYLPVLDGTSILVGSFFAPRASETAYPFDPPNWFNTHTYALQHGPGTHVGVLIESKLPIPRELGLLSIKFGPVLGWNNLDNRNNNLSFISGVSWRSLDFRTWVDIVTTYGDGADDFSEGPGEGGSAYFALSSTGETLDRFAGYLEVLHNFSDTFQTVFQTTYGFQEGGDIAPSPIFITRDSAWYGANVNFRYVVQPGLNFNLRGEWFKDENAANVLWAGSPGDVYAMTANVTWQVEDFVRIRPEIRYDIYDGDGLPLFANNTENEQFVAMVDVILQF